MNMQNLMAQAQKMQRDIMKKKEEINKKEFVGKSEFVEAKFMGDKSLVSVKISSDLNLNDDKDIVEDMIVIAVNDALKKIDDETQKVMGPYGNSLNGLF